MRKEKRLDIFSEYLPLWVVISMIAGALVGNSFPDFAKVLGSWSVANVSIPVAAVLLFMMFPITRLA